MTSISFTSGELMDIMSALVDRETDAHNTAVQTAENKND